MYSASSTSLVVSAGVSISRSGTLTPWRAFILPPTITSALTSESETRSVTFNFRRPSSIINSIPTVRPLSKAICSRVSVIVILPGLIKSVASFISANSTISPFVHITGSGTPSAISPTLNFGPCKSPSTSTCFPSAFAVARSRGYSSSNTPPLRWEQLSRKTFTPASIIFGSISSVQEAGPRVATIFVTRSDSGGTGKTVLDMSGALLTTGLIRSFMNSACRDTLARYPTASRGKSPIAASPDSITASEPSHTAFATSFTSALVGTAFLIMLSSICVAVITNSPLALAFLIMYF